jgi:hypothetical protein
VENSEGGFAPSKAQGKTAVTCRSLFTPMTSAGRGLGKDLWRILIRSAPRDLPMFTALRAL